MNKVAVDPSLHPIDQYRSEWIEIVQFLAILYIFSKSDFYKNDSKSIDATTLYNGSQFITTMNRYKHLENNSTEFYEFLQSILNPGEYGEVKALFDQVQTRVAAGNYHAPSLKRIFTSIRDDIKHVHVPKLRAVLIPATIYFRNGSVPNKDVELQLIESLDNLRNPRIRRMLDMILLDLDKLVSQLTL